MRRLLSSNRIAVAISAVALLCAAGGGAYAARSGGTITLCVAAKTGVIYKSARCAKHDGKISWSATGSRGLTGATGPAGAQGPGAIAINYLSATNTETAPVLIKTIGPISLYGLCQPQGGGYWIGEVGAVAAASGWATYGWAPVSTDPAKPTWLDGAESGPSGTGMPGYTAYHQTTPLLTNGSTVYNVTLTVSSGTSVTDCGAMGTVIPAN